MRERKGREGDGREGKGREGERKGREERARERDGRGEEGPLRLRIPGNFFYPSPPLGGKVTKTHSFIFHGCRQTWANVACG